MTKNTVSLVASAIVAVMNEATKSENRQSEVIVYMMNDEGATYTTARLAAILSKSGKDKTDALDDLISDVSDEYDNLLGRIEVHTEEKKKTDSKAKKEQLAYTLEELMNKRKATRAMMERAITSVFHLRTIGATKVSLKNKRITCVQPDEEDKEVMVREIYSGRELSNAAAKSLETLKPQSEKKKTNAAQSKVTLAEGLRSSLESANKYLNTEDFKKPLVDLSDDLESKAEELLKTLMQRKFADDKGRIDANDVMEYFFPGMKNKKSAA